MRVAIVGSTGALGQCLVRELRQRGHEVRELGRRVAAYRVDVSTGAGLDQAFDGCDAVVNASNDSSKSARSTLVDGARHVGDAAHRTGVRHLVGVSIVGCEGVPLEYFRLKHLQERVVVEGAVPWSLLCSTQFHGYLSRTFAAMSSWRLLPLPRALLAPVAAIEVAGALCDIAVGEPMRGRRLMAGPKNADLRDLARIWLEATGRSTLVLPIRLPGSLGAALREGVLAGTDADLRGAVTFAEELGASGTP